MKRIRFIFNAMDGGLSYGLISLISLRNTTVSKSIECDRMLLERLSNLTIVLLCTVVVVQGVNFK